MSDDPLPNENKSHADPAADAAKKPGRDAVQGTVVEAMPTAAANLDPQRQADAITLYLGALAQQLMAGWAGIQLEIAKVQRDIDVRVEGQRQRTEFAKVIRDTVVWSLAIIGVVFVLFVALRVTDKEGVRTIVTTLAVIITAFGTVAATRRAEAKSKKQDE